MIQAYCDGKVIVGITRGNVERLTAGRPIRVQLLRQNVTEVLVLFGEDKPAILRQLEEAGMDIAAVWKADAERDPQ